MVKIVVGIGCLLPVVTRRVTSTKESALVMNADTFYLIGDTNGLCREDVQEAQRTKEEGNRRYR